jgi:hypothetical protein
MVLLEWAGMIKKLRTPSGLILKVKSRQILLNKSDVKQCSIWVSHLHQEILSMFVDSGTNFCSFHLVL